MKLGRLSLGLLGLLLVGSCDNSEVSPQEAAYMLTGKCLPTCGGRECGDDGCGVECGACKTDETCFFGNCLDTECDDGNEVDWDGCTLGQRAEIAVSLDSGNGMFMPQPQVRMGPRFPWNRIPWVRATPNPG